MSRASRTNLVGPLVGRLTTAAVDQSFASLRNSFLLLAVAASAGVEVFGAFAVAYTAVSFVLAVARAYVGIPLTIDLPLVGQAGSTSSLTGHAMSLSLAASVPVLAVLALAGAIDSQHAGMLVALGLVAPVVLLQDTIRYVASATGRPTAALVADACWLAAAVGVLALGVAGTQSPDVLVALWGAGGAIALVVGWWGVGRPVLRIDGLRRVVAEDRRRTRLGAEGAISASTSLLTVNGIAIFAGASVVGEVRAATTLFGLMSVMLVFLSFGLGPEMAKMRVASRVTVAAAAAATTAAVVIVWGLLVLSDPFGVSSSLLGASWDGARPLIPYLIAEGVGLCLWVSFGTMLRVSGRTSITLRISATYAVCSVVSILGVAAALGSSIAIVRTMSILGVAVGCATVVAARRAHLPPQ